jgi:3'-5' exoribonuclease
VHLKHLVLAHHGELEFGSPKRPKTPEAMLLSMIDDLDAKMNHWRAIFAREPGDAWTQFQKYYDRYLYKGRPYPDAAPGEPPAVEPPAPPPRPARAAPPPAKAPAPAARPAEPPAKADLKFKPFSQISLLEGGKDGGKGGADG